MRSYEVDRAAQGPLLSLGFRRAACSPIGRTQLSERSRAQPIQDPKGLRQDWVPRVGLHWEYHKVGGGRRRRGEARSRERGEGCWEGRAVRAEVWE